MAEKGGREPKVVDVVSQDKDWRGVIENELRCQENWQKDWGFLADNSMTENPKTKEERIQVLEEKLKSMNDVNIYESVSQMKYNGPSYPVDKAMVIRAVAKNSKGEFSEINTKVYFITTGDLYKYQDLTVISIVTNPENLFDPEIGIYVAGNMYIEAKKKAEEESGEGKGGWGRFNPWRMNNCNYLMKGQEWEREAFVTIFDKSEYSRRVRIRARLPGPVTTRR